MFLLTTFLAIPVNKAFLLVSVRFGTQTTLFLGLVFVLLLPRRITRLCGGVMDQQAVSAQHNAPWNSRRVICECMWGSPLCVVSAWTQEITHWEAALEAAGLAAGRLSGSSKKKLNDFITAWWTVGEQASSSYTAFNQQKKKEVALLYNARTESEIEKPNMSWSGRVEHAQIFIGRDQKGQRDNSCWDAWRRR